MTPLYSPQALPTWLTGIRPRARGMPWRSVREPGGALACRASSGLDGRPHYVRMTMESIRLTLPAPTGVARAATR